jgi:hypothetical protein
MNLACEQLAMFELTPPAKKRRTSFKLRSQKVVLTENDVERAINDYLRLDGWRLHRQHVGKARFPGGAWVELYPEGTADWLATRGRNGGECLYYEAKRPGASPSPAQTAWLEQARREGYPAACFDTFSAFLAWYKSAGFSRA